MLIHTQSKVTQQRSLIKSSFNGQNTAGLKEQQPFLFTQMLCDKDVESSESRVEPAYQLSPPFLKQVLQA